jgi:hypothetical protein
VRPFAQVDGRRYFECEQCRLVYLTPEQRLGPAEEFERYSKHQNDPMDARYRAFLSRLSRPLVERLADGAEGLDYGSGPGPTLSVMLEEQGFNMEIFDPFFAPGADMLRRSYDFITCTETAEHFHTPGDEFDRLRGLLRPGGWLGIMSEMLQEDHVFRDWYYIRDPTHVSFYRPGTMEWIATAHGWTLELLQRNVALFQAPSQPKPDATSALR